jgi:hypothetical protein
LNVARVCLLTTGQVSTNPRLVKEADALTEVGHSVHVIAGRGTSWVEENDRALLRDRTWSCTTVGGQQSTDRLRYASTRMRHRLARPLASLRYAPSLARHWALARIAPDLARAARRTPARLYIAHYPAALPAAVAAAALHRARVAYDAEDLYTGEVPTGDPPDDLIRATERAHLPSCSFVTTSSPGIAAVYADLYAITPPTVIHNVFPLADRPAALRPVSSDGHLTLYWFSQTIGPGRGLEDAVLAMSRLDGLSLELHLRGWWHPGYRDKLLSLAGHSGLQPDQIVSHAPAPPDEMVRLASMHDIGLALEHPNTANHDLCLSNKIFTYLLAGAAVAGTATAGQGPLLDSLGPAAISYPPGDAGTLAGLLRPWLENRHVLQGARESAWNWGMRHYNWDAEKKTFLELVEQALAT